MELLRRCLKHSRLLIFMNRPTRRPEILFLQPAGSAVLFSCELLLKEISAFLPQAGSSNFLGGGSIQIDPNCPLGLIQ